MVILKKPSAPSRILPLFPTKPILLEKKDSEDEDSKNAEDDSGDEAEADAEIEQAAKLQSKASKPFLEKPVAQKVATIPREISPSSQKPVYSADVERAASGITGLDELVEGGFPRGSVMLVVGGPGSGKSIFSLQFLLNGALKYGEPGAYISMEEPEESIRKTGEQFGWNVRDLEEKGLFHIVWRDPYEVKSFAKVMGGQIYYLIKDAGIKRIAFDSITYFTLTEENRFKLRKEIAELSTRLKAVGVSSLFISEVPQAEIRKGRYGMEEFVADGIILLNNFLVRDKHVRAIEVLKMRHTHHDTLLHPFAIGKKGLEIYPREQVFLE